MSDSRSTAAEKREAAKTAAADEAARTETETTTVKTDAVTDDRQDTVDLVATGSFYAEANMQGQLLQAGDTFTTTRARAVELRANGLVAYADESAEKEAAKDDPEASTDMGNPVITTRSIRRART